MFPQEIGKVPLKIGLQAPQLIEVDLICCVCKGEAVELAIIRDASMLYLVNMVNDSGMLWWI